MVREAMKELIRARVQCTDAAVGSLLPRYEQGGLDEGTCELFTEHLGECLHCMALYNIETKHQYGFIDAERTRARRVEVRLRPWLPSPKLAVFALVVWALVIPLATVRTPHLNPQEGGGGVEAQSNESIARVEPSPSTEDDTGRDGPAPMERPQPERRRPRSNHDSAEASGQKSEMQSPVQTVDQAPLGNDAGKATEMAIISEDPFTPPEKPVVSEMALGFDVALCQHGVQPAYALPPATPTLPATTQLSDNNRAPKEYKEDSTSQAVQRLNGGGQVRWGG